jgi:hypothetical protein
MTTSSAILLWRWKTREEEEEEEEEGMASTKNDGL